MAGDDERAAPEGSGSDMVGWLGYERERAGSMRDAEEKEREERRMEDGGGRSGESGSEVGRDPKSSKLERRKALHLNRVAMWTRTGRAGVGRIFASSVQPARGHLHSIVLRREGYGCT